MTSNNPWQKLWNLHKDVLFVFLFHSKYTNHIHDTKLCDIATHSDFIKHPTVRAVMPETRQCSVSCNFCGHVEYLNKESKLLYRRSRKKLFLPIYTGLWPVQPADNEYSQVSWYRTYMFFTFLMYVSYSQKVQLVNIVLCYICLFTMK